MERKSFEPGPSIAPIAFVTITPARRQPGLGEPQELVRHEMERDRVGEESVDHDHVPALRVVGQEATAVSDRDLHARVVLGDAEETVRHVDHDWVELDDAQVELRKVAPHALLGGAGAEPDEEHVPGAGLYASPRSKRSV